MTGRRLVLLRHGRTASNHEGRVQGQRDVDLDDAGRAQAARTAPVLAALAPSVLWSSDLARARQTAEPLAAATGLGPVLDERLREFGFGEREGLTHAEYAEIDADELAALRAGRYDDIPAAERTDAVRSRMHDALGDLLAVIEPGATGVAVSHGGALRVVVGALLGWPDDLFRTLLGLANCGWVELAEHPSDGGLRLGAYNRVVPPGPADPDFLPVATGG